MNEDNFDCLVLSDPLSGEIYPAKVHFVNQTVEIADSGNFYSLTNLPNLTNPTFTVGPLCERIAVDGDVFIKASGSFNYTKMAALTF